jgi:hypothetical protein
LGNLYDFDPARDAVPVADLLPIDRFILHRLQQLVERVRKAYEDYEFHALYHGLHNFCAVDLSAFYLDVLKDRLYTSSATSRLRRSAQTAMHEIWWCGQALWPRFCRSADEVWRYVPMRDKAASVHLTEFPAARPDLLDESLAAEWERLLQVRDEVLRALEAARKDKRIGSAQEAAVELTVPEASFDFLAAHREDLETICIVPASRSGGIGRGPRRHRAGGAGAGREVPPLLELPRERRGFGRAPQPLRAMHGRPRGARLTAVGDRCERSRAMSPTIALAIVLTDQATKAVLRPSSGADIPIVPG